MSAAIFLELTQDERIERIEAIRRYIHELMAEKGEDSDPDLPLSEASTTWLVRMRQALVDESVSQDAFNELANVFAAYRATLSIDEGTELTRRLMDRLDQNLGAGHERNSRDDGLLIG